MNKILYILLIAFSLILICCEQTTINLRDWQIGLMIDSVSFCGDWSAERINGVDILRINMNLENTSNTEIKLKFPINYMGNQPYLYLTNDKFILDGNGDWRDSNTLLINSEFKRKDNMDLSPDLITSNSKSLRNEHNYKLNLVYNRNNESVLDINLKSENWNLIPNGFNFNVNYEVVHDATADGGRLNLIVMAEGYRVDQMDDYRAYVADAFQDVKSFHEMSKSKNNVHPYNHIENKFFSYYWNHTRVIRMDTISPQTGVDQNFFLDDIQSILNYSMVGLRSLGDTNRIKAVIDNTKPLDLEMSDIDAIIIFVNDENLRSYSFTYGNELAYKYGQPVHPVFICAPINKNPSDMYYHNYVQTHAIAHELGHALARLQDEYVEEGKNFICYSYYRNVSEYISPLKWQKFIDLGFNSNDLSDDRVDAFLGAFYRPDCYRPTVNSTMREDASIDIQFGPINTYHLVASIKIRLGEVDYEVKDQKYDDTLDSYEWEHYSIEQFRDEWYPELKKE